MIVAPNPFVAFNVLRSEMERLIDDVSASPFSSPANTPASVFPAINVWQDDKAVYAEAELPGFRAQDIDVIFEDGQLVIRGKRESVRPENGASLVRRERFSGTFERALRLNIPVDAANVRADLVSGVLTIVLPRPEAAQPRRIEIKPA